MHGETVWTRSTVWQVAIIAVAVAVLLSSIAGVALLAADRAAETDPDTVSTQPTATPDGVDIPPAFARLHAGGVTGSNVSVGVVDASGFDTDRGAIADQIAGTRTFAAAGSIHNAGRSDHGTAAASILARTAPDADLYLARVDSEQRFRAAVAWLLQQDVDVIVAPVAFYGKRGDGSSGVARAAAAAVDRGVVFVAPTGNLGDRHWVGAFSPARNGVHRFGQRRSLVFEGDERQLTVWLSWGERAAGQNASTRRNTRRHTPRVTPTRRPDSGAFSLLVYRVDGNRTRLVARSRPFDGDETANERITTTVDPDGTYLLRLRGPEGAAGVPVEISSPTHELRDSRRVGSLVAPATGDGILAVGAYDRRTDRVEPFSSVGTPSRPGVDVIAPDRLRTSVVPSGLVGSSAAAPYVAGVVALQLEAAPGLTPAAVERLLETTADDVSSTPAYADGAGVVDPERAVSRARNVTRRQRKSSRPLVVKPAFDKYDGGTLGARFRRGADYDFSSETSVTVTRSGRGPRDSHFTSS
jgi:hypothetical protein